MEYIPGNLLVPYQCSEASEIGSEEFLEHRRPGLAKAAENSRTRACLDTFELAIELWSKKRGRFSRSTFGRDKERIRQNLTSPWKIKIWKKVSISNILSGWMLLESNNTGSGGPLKL